MSLTGAVWMPSRLAASPVNITRLRAVPARRSTLVGAGLVLHWRGFTIAINRPEPQVQGGDDEQVEHRRGDQATQDDNGHRVRYFLTWDDAEDHQGYESQPRCQRGHQDRREPLSR